LTNDSPFEFAFRPKVHQRHTEENGQETLTGKDKHCESGEDEHDPDQILENKDGDSKWHRDVRKPAARPVVIKVIDRQTYQQNGDRNQRSDEEYDRQDAEEYESFI
jgi:hypothetical protein